MEHKAFLKEINLFAGLSDEELDELGRSVEAFEVPKGGVVVEEGSPGGVLHIVREGRVRVEKGTGKAAVSLAELGPRSFFGEMALIDGSAHSARVVAAEKSTLLRIDRMDLDIILHWNTALGQRFWRTVAMVLAQRLRRSNDKIIERMAQAENTQKRMVFRELIEE
jgi:CRP-like cAMP-binding protein